MTVGRVHATGRKGSGFSIATATGRLSRVVLTAAHVVRDRDPSSIVFVHPDGRSFPVERVESDEDIDVAVLHLREDLDGFVAARVRDRLPWQVDARPRDNDPRLTGEVIDSRRLFSKSGGRDVRVVQLRAHETLGDYQGYSGSPVMLGLAESPPVLGVLIEQLRWRTKVSSGQQKPPASNVLYAIAIQDVLARFGLDTTWVPVGDTPSDEQLASGYIEAITARFAERFDGTPHVALALERGDRGPAAVPKALRRRQARIRERMKPRLSPDPPGRDPDSGRPVADLAEFQRERTRVVLLGRPGAGKSVTLRHLVTDLGAPWTSGSAGDGARIPIFADLSEWHDRSASLTAFLQAQLTSLGQHALAEHLPDLMRTDRLVLLLDGLNELPRLTRDPATDRLDDPRVAAIADLGQRPDWDAVGCVLSCRANDFPGGPEWHDLHLLDLDDERVAALAQAYLDDLPDAPAVTRDFLRRLGPSASEGLRGLIRNPFFMVMALEYYSVKGTIPDRLTDLLELTVAEVLDREQAGDRADEVRRRLGRLAFRMTAEGEFGAVDRQRAAAWFGLGSESTVDAATAGFVRRAAEGAGLLTASGGEIWFAHQLFQEFFAASFLATEPLTAALVETVAQPRFNEIWSGWADLDPELTGRLIPFLGDSSAGVRRSAATILRPLRDPRAADPLALALTDPDETVSWSAALSLAWLPDRRATPVLLERLRSGESGVRQVAARALGVLGDPSALDPLVEVLRHDDSADVRAAAAAALGASADTRALRPLIETLVTSRDELVSRAAARALGRLRDPRAVPDLLARLTESVGRSGAVDGLIAMGEAALDPLMDLLSHGRTPEQRRNAAFVLGLSHRERVIPALVTALADEDPQVRRESAGALGHFGEPALVPLIEVLDDGDESEQTSAIYALGVMGDPRAVPHLLAAVRSESGEVAEQAARSLRSGGETAIGPLVGLLLDDVDPQTRWNAAMALSGLDDAGPAALAGVASSDDPFVRMIAVAGLAETARGAALFAFYPGAVDPGVVEPLATALHDTDPAVRRFAAVGLAELGDARAVPVLAKMIQADDAQVRTAAVGLLGRVEAPAAVDVLVATLRHADAEIRAAACEALGRSLRPRSIRMIVDAADSPGALTELLTTWRAADATPELVLALRRATTPLVAALRDPERSVVFAAQGALEDAAGPLADVSTEDPALRARVREMLVPLSDPAAVSALIATLGQVDDDSGDVFDLRSRVADLLGKIGDQRAVPALIGLLPSSDRDVLSAAAHALARLGGPDALPAMITVLRNPAALDMIFSLERDVLAVADERAPALLLDALRDPVPGAGRPVEDLLRELGELALAPLIVAIGDPDPEFARTAARALDPDAYGFLSYEREQRPWRTAVDALDRLSDAEVDLLVAAMHRDDETVARVARDLLTRLEHPAAVAATSEPVTPKRTVGELIDALAAGDEEARLEAATELGECADRDAIGPLTARLADDADTVRAAAARALGRLGDRSVVDRLGAMLDDPSWLVVSAAAAGLAGVGGADALRLVLAALDEEVRREPVARALRAFDQRSWREVGAAEILGILLPTIRTPRGSFGGAGVYAAAREVLPKLGEPALTPMLAALDDSHDAVRHLAAEVLAAGADLRALPLVTWMAEFDRGEYVSGGGKPRDAAGAACQDLRDAYPALEPLIEAMASDDRLTRFGAAFVLANREWPGATPTLVDALHDADHRIRWGAADRLGESGDKRAIEPLTAALADPDKAVRDKVTEALTRFGQAAAGPVAAALGAADADARAQAAVVLGYVGGADAVDPLVAALGDPAVGVCAQAAWALGNLARRGLTDDIDTGVIGPALVTAFRAVDQYGPDDFTHWPIVHTLATFEPARLVDVLIEALGSRHRSVRLTAVKELGKLGDRRAIAPLNRALSDEDGSVREDAAGSLRKFADVSSVEPLIERLSRDEGFPLLAVVEALAAIGDPRAAAPLIPLLSDTFEPVSAAAAAALTTLAAAPVIQEFDEQEGSP